MNTQSQTEEIIKLKTIISELIDVIRDISIDRYGSIDKDMKTLCQLKDQLRDDKKE